MNLTHLIATALAGALMLEATGLAQTTSVPDIVAIPREEAVHVLVTNIQIGSSVHVELVDGNRVEGRLLEKSDEDIAVLSDGVRQVIPVADIVSLRLRVPPGMKDGKAFGIGAATGAGILVGVAFLGFFAH
jgi:hypothetical protein